MIDLLLIIIFIMLVFTAIFQIITYFKHAGITTRNEWKYHQEAIKNDVKVYGYASFKDFKREFDKRDWEIEDFERSLFTPDHSYINNTGSRIHAGVIVFDFKGMILNYDDYVRAMKYVDKYIEDKSLNRQRAKEDKNLWN